MAKFTDFMISPLPIRVIDLKIERSKLKLKGFTVLQFGHLPGRISKRKGASYECWAFSYIVRGKGSFQVDGQQLQRLEAGSLYWEWPGASFDYGPDPNESWDEYYVSFEGTRVNEWLEAGIISPDSVMQIGLDNRWIHKIETIGALLESGIPDNADRAALMVESLIFEFYAVNASRSSFYPSQKPEYVLHVLDDIANSLYQPWNEQQVWERNHLSRSSLRRIVHQNTGYSLNEYVNRLKISEAKKLLTYTSLQIKDIAYKLGFDDAAYFSRLFKKFTGISPNKFREKL
ncbi:AraC family transcriptional regulator [Paenibacillus eucommiae]|uniref:AraC-like DNA-binding protein n=1 Tax=Paenibacillus eucommiae TaxID=1355755 RepID=A0ABS4IU23_9BACL|nr:AraC family transcriptional regulator [Paenibacillus eucommiae]MBP1991070.1 AraC-like DNA-binding protein [Paenibacillus eucommiae]